MKVHSATIRLTTSSGVNIGAIVPHLQTFRRTPGALLIEIVRMTRSIGLFCLSAEIVPSGIAIRFATTTAKMQISIGRQSQPQS